MKPSLLFGFLITGLILSARTDAPPPTQRTKPQNTLKLKLRTRVETFKGSGVWDETLVMQEVPVAEVAIIICDMWAKHWCEGATARCDALADRMEIGRASCRERVEMA